jgi:hypothetical protein
MQPENIKEYQMIRQEMIAVKDCITKYIGYVLGGSGAAVFLIARMEHNVAGQGGQAFASGVHSGIVSLAISIIINFVLLIIYYKFKSHNRFAGYCKLLNHERYDHHSPGKDIVAWEVLVGNLRDQDISKNIIGNKFIISNIQFGDLNNEIISEYSIKKSFWKGVSILFKSIKGDSDSKSWAFPPVVTAMFFILSFGFYSVGVYFLLDLFKEYFTIYNLSHFIVKNLAIVFLLSLVFSVQILLWVIFIKNLHYLMYGGYRVQSFFWKFMPLRASFLCQDQIEPKYIAIKISIGVS